MEVTSGKIAWFVAGTLLGIFFVLQTQAPHTATAAPQAVAATSTRIVQTAAKPEVIDAVYPLYASGISWSMKVPVTLPPNSDYNPTNGVIAGYQVSSLPTAITNDLSAVFEPFRNYYDRMLLADGWKINTQYEADGAGGSLWGYTKGDQILIFTYTSSFLNQEPNTPRQCPCTLVFTIIGGTLK